MNGSATYGTGRGVKDASQRWMRVPSKSDYPTGGDQSPPELRTTNMKTQNIQQMTAEIDAHRAADLLVQGSYYDGRV